MKKQTGALELRRPREVTLGDLLDRLLEKGLLLHGDLLITVADIPLLGVNLRLALAGMSTMLRYGFLKDWDEAHRSAAALRRKEKKSIIDENKFSFDPVMCWHSRGASPTWKSASIHLTGRGLQIRHREPALEINYVDIKELHIEEIVHNNEKREELVIFLFSGGILRLYTEKIQLLFSQIRDLKSSWQSKKDISSKNIWRLITRKNIKPSWEKGKFLIDENRLCWREELSGNLSFAVDNKNIYKATILKDESGPEETHVLQLTYLGQIHTKEAYFAGEKTVLEYWLNLFKEGKDTGLETCPSCGVPAPTRQILDQGCFSCGWKSPRVKT